MRNKVSHHADPGPAARAAPATRCCPPPRPRTRCSRTSRATSVVTVTASPGKGLDGDPRPGRAAGRARVRRRAPPRRADGPRPRRARRDLRPADGGRASPGSSCPAATPTRPATTPTRCRCCEDLADARPAVRAGRDHRLPRVAPDDPRRPDRAVDVGQAALRDPRGQQPDLRPGGDPRLGAPDARPRDHDAAAARHARPGRPHQAADDGDQDRRRGVDPVPGQAQGHLRPAGRARRLHRRAVPRAVRARRSPSRRRWSRACTSSRSTRSPRPRPGARSCWTGCDES